MKRAGLLIVAPALLHGPPAVAAGQAPDLTVTAASKVGEDAGLTLRLLRKGDGLEVEVRMGHFGFGLGGEWRSRPRATCGSGPATGSTRAHRRAARS